MTPCSVAECAEPSRTRGWCEMHYTRWRRHGSPARAVVLTAEAAVAVPATGDRRWRERAACRTAAPEVFHPAPGGSALPARAVCAGCGVLGDCRDEALERNERYGVWGGLSTQERDRLRTVLGAGGEAHDEGGGDVACALSGCPRPPIEGDWCQAHAGIGGHVVDLEQTVETVIAACDGAAHTAWVPPHQQPAGWQPAAGEWRQLDLRGAATAPRPMPQEDL